jgi:hypothetical protein
MMPRTNSLTRRKKLKKKEDKKRKRKKLKSLHIKNFIEILREMDLIQIRNLVSSKITH